MSSTAKIESLLQVSRSVGDIDASVAWYRDVLGLKHLFTAGTLAFFDCGGTRLMLSQAEDEPAPESILYFRVDSIDAAHRELTDRGASFTHPPHRIHVHDDGTEEWMAFLTDPDGRPLAIASQVTPGA